MTSKCSHTNGKIVRKMTLEVVDVQSLASGAANEDRAGTAPPLAWVIDGATDLVPEPLTGAVSDASWFAAAMHALLTDLDANVALSLADLPALVANRLQQRFAAEARTPPRGREDHPSASAVVIRATEDSGIEFVSVGDCTLLVETDGRLAKIGVADEDAGDRWVADALTGQSKGGDIAERPLTRADLWPRLRAIRARMNTPSGYGVFSITAPPAAMIRHGRLDASPGTRILLASDGFMRLIDVFRAYDSERLFAAAWANGLAPLFTELRELEMTDAECRRFPRAKTSDDTTAMLLRVTPPA
jgi:hypothetical protein